MSVSRDTLNRDYAVSTVCSECHLKKNVVQLKDPLRGRPTEGSPATDGLLWLKNERYETRSTSRFGRMKERKNLSASFFSLKASFLAAAAAANSIASKKREKKFCTKLDLLPKQSEEEKTFLPLLIPFLILPAAIHFSQGRTCVNTREQGLYRVIDWFWHLHMMVTVTGLETWSPSTLLASQV